VEERKEVADGNKEQKKALNLGCLWRKRWLMMDSTMNGRKSFQTKSELDVLEAEIQRLQENSVELRGSAWHWK